LEGLNVHKAGARALLFASIEYSRERETSTMELYGIQGGFYCNRLHLLNFHPSPQIPCQKASYENVVIYIIGTPALAKMLASSCKQTCTCV
jgi:hypothetical protein